MSNNKYLDDISKTRHCVNGVPMASAYECIFFRGNSHSDNSDTNDDGTYNKMDINLEDGEVSLYVDGVFKFGPIKGRATITLR